MFKQNVPQMVQRLTELQGIYQGMAVPVGPVMFDQVRTGEHERRDLFAILVKADVLQPSAHAQVKRPAKDVGGF
jgi:tellurite resistance-related uncharacterized protein